MFLRISWQRDFISIHMTRKQTLAIAIYKVANNILLKCIREVFTFCEEIGYDFRNQNLFRRPLAKSVYYNMEV